MKLVKSTMLHVSCSIIRRFDFLHETVNLPDRIHVTNGHLLIQIGADQL
ncbi:hypothetical protein [Salisediminibacterium halotolerans]|nr:hypothetical protein [Salisediminibacterium halotolerans]